jgi:hypothetical protein
MAELQEVVRCRCDEAYRDRGLKDPQCECDSADAVKVVADRIEALTAKLEHAKKGLRKILRTSDRNSAWDIAIATLEKLKGESHD